MVLKLEIKKTLSSRSDRVKCVDFHPSEPWLLVSLYNGQVHIWNYEQQTLVKSFEICDLPSRTGKFIARKNWFIVGSDDMHLRVFNYNTHERVHAFEAHTDYIRCLAVHPTQPYVLSSADDMTIRLWDWDKQWRNVMTFEGHTHYVMCVAFNPKDSNTFASASLDKTIKVWNLGSSTPNYTLEGHEKGVNWVDYYYGGEKPYLVSAADDRTSKIWDYQNKTCVSTLEGHTQNVCVACFHPELPVILTGSEDGTVRIWHANTYRLENTLNYGFERVWTIGYMKGTNAVGIGYDEGTIVIKLGREDPVVSMDSAGKVIFAKHNEIQSVFLQPSDFANVKDGDRLSVGFKELGNAEVYPQVLSHSPNGRFAVVCGDGEYIIYTALSWRNKSFGNALEFVWNNDSNEYAVRESGNKVKLFRAFKERLTLTLPFSAEAMMGGALLGLRGNTFVCFYDWNSGSMVYWSENGELFAVCADESYFILRYRSGAVEEALSSGGIPEDGVEQAFDVLHEIPESVKSGQWIGDCFIYTTTNNRLSYLVGGQVHTISHFDSTMYLLGYLPKESKVFVCDKDLSLFAYSLSLSVLEYQTAILRKDFNTAQSILPSLPNAQRNKVARFLEGLDLKKMAMEVTTDIEHRFELAIQLRMLQTAYEIAKTIDSEIKWKQVGDFALNEWRLPLAEECLSRAKDYPGLFLLYQSIGDVKSMTRLAETAQEEGLGNLAFLCYLQTQSVEKCLDLLISTSRFAEAALFARTYCPMRVAKTVHLWREHITKSGWKKIADAIASPAENEELFPGMGGAVLMERKFADLYRGNFNSSSGAPAEKHAMWQEMVSKDLIEELKGMGNQLPTYSELLDQMESQKRMQASAAKSPQSTSSVPPYQSPPKTELSPKPQPVTSPVPAPASIPPETTSQPSSQPKSSSTASSPVKSPTVPSTNNRSPSAKADLLTGPQSPVVSGIASAPVMKPQVGVTSSSKNPSSVASSASGTKPSSLFPQSEDLDAISDTFSMDVNTTGTGSLKGDVDANSEFSFMTDKSAAARPQQKIDMDEIDAVLASTAPVASSGDTQRKTSLTGDDELDELLNM